MARDTQTSAKRFALSFWVWSGLAVIFTLLLAGMLAALLLFGEKRGAQALENGQRVLITLSTGEVKGKAHKAATPAPKPEAHEEKAGDKPVEKTVEPAEKPEAPSAKEHPEPAAEPEKTPHAEEEKPEAAPVASEAPSADDRTPAARIKPQEHPEVTESPLAAPEATAKTQEEAPPPPPVRDGSNSLSAAPLPSLVEKNPKAGDLPTVAKDGTRPAEYYAKSFTRVGEMPVVSIIVVGLGHSRTATEAALALPDGVSLSFSPYAKESPLWVKSARALGHEAYIDLPLEPQDYPATDPGPQGLLTALPAKENITRLHWTLARFAGFVGVMALPDTKFAAEAGAVKPVMAELSKRGVLFIAADRERSVVSAADKDALSADMILDEEISAAAITKQLDALAALAKKRGHALAVARAYPVTLTQLSKWTGGASGKGVQLAPASAIFKLK